MVSLKRLRSGDLRIEDRGPAAYLLSSFAHYGVRALIPRRIHRDTTQVHDEYNHQRDEYWKDTLTEDEYLYGDGERERWVLIEDKLVRGTIRDVREHILPLLAERVAKYSKPGDLVVEFGAGTGRNLGYLSREVPDRSYLGLELTPKSVEDARRMLAKFDLKVEMRQADVTKPISLERRAAVAYSVQALEQLPEGLSRLALQQMAGVAERAIVCIEPIRELYENSLRGWTSRLRQHRADYLAGLPSHARSLDLQVVTQRRIGFAEHPLNEVCELVIELS